MKNWLLVLIGLLLVSSFVLAKDIPSLVKLEDSQGYPLKDAVVQFSAGGKTYPTHLTNSNGITYRDLIPAGQLYTLTISKEGYKSKTITGIIPNIDTTYVVNTTLYVGSTQANISVKARALVGGISQIPLSGATVTYIVGSYNYPGGTTDSQGYAQAVTLQPGQVFQAKVEKTGYTTVISQKFTVPSTGPYYPVVSLAVPSIPPTTQDTGTLTVIVKDNYSNPVNGATVKLFTEGTSTVMTKFTNSSGSTSFTVEKGNYFTIEVSKSNYLDTEKTVYFSQNSSSVTSNITLYPTGTTAQATTNVQVRAFVTNQQGTPISGASVSFIADGIPYPGGTTSNGYSNIVTLQPGQVGSVTVSFSGYNTAQVGFVVGDNPSQTVFVTLIPSTQQPDVEIIASITNSSNGLPIQGASVNFYGNGQNIPGGLTDSGGLSQSVFFPQNTLVTLSASAIGFNSSSTSFYVPSSGPFTVNLSLSPIQQPPLPVENTEVKVKVTDSSNGSNIQNAYVIINENNNSHNLGTTDSEGTSPSIFLAPGTSGTATASAPDFISNSVSFVTQSSGSQIIYLSLSPVQTDPSSNNSPNLSGIPNQFVEENDGYQDNIVDLWAYANDDEDSDSTLSFSITDESDSGLIDCFVDQDRYIDCYAPDDDETGENEVTVRVTDSDGATDTDTFTVFVEDDDFDDDDDFMCSDIEIDNDDISIQEGLTTTVDIDVFNDNSRSFFVESVSVTESSADYSAFPLDDDFTISGNDSEEIRIKFIANHVSSSKDSTIKVRLTGEFSNGVDCHIDDTETEIDVTVRNSSFENDITVTAFPQTVELNAGETKIVKLDFENDFSSRKCFDLKTSVNGSGFTASVEDDEFCIDSKDNREIDLVIKSVSGTFTQSGTVQVEADFGSGTEFVFITVKPATLQPQTGGLAVTSFTQSVILSENDSETFTATISNSSQTDLSNIAVTMSNLPQGVFFEPVFMQKLPKGSSTTISTRIFSSNPMDATFTALLEVSSDQLNTAKPVSITVRTAEGTASPDEDNGIIGGLIGLSSNFAGAVILILLLVLVVVIVVALVRRK